MDLLSSMNSRLIRDEGIYRLLIEKSGNAYAYHNFEEGRTECFGDWENLLGFPREEYRSLDQITELVQDCYYAELQECLLLDRKNKQHESVEFKFLNRDVWLSATADAVYDASGNPLRMYYNYGKTNYQFSGGDAIYEDINHDGQINELDIVYLGNSNPTFNGGFGIDFTYGKWSLKTSFNIRLGADIINMARMKAEDMRTNKNQSAAVNWRWRKNGDITEIPRAMSTSAGDSYNALASDRYVESGDFIRLQYVQLSYQFDQKLIRHLGIKGLRFSASGNNLFFFTKYKGTDPEHSASGYSPAFDNDQTPRSRSVTFNLNIDF